MFILTFTANGEFRHIVKCFSFLLFIFTKRLTHPVFSSVLFYINVLVFKKKGKEKQLSFVSLTTFS